MTFGIQVVDRFNAEKCFQRRNNSYHHTSDDHSAVKEPTEIRRSEKAEEFIHSSCCLYLNKMIGCDCKWVSGRFQDLINENRNDHRYQRTWQKTKFLFKERSFPNDHDEDRKHADQKYT